ncbi:receptor tyrosine-protein kinase erbB-4-like [Petromyzon marinus]|uniref:receptor tyrosine-protein kinase erbB-4-like n=1 Tax=Petromyzon marinus TaxID=7757 RepID=UPI003F72F24D
MQPILWRMGLLHLVCALASVGKVHSQIDCAGTTNKLNLLSNKEKQYEILREMYTNCEIVMGNLEITNILNGSDLSFLRSIREVSGYVLIALNEVDYVPLENLRLIRGNTLYDNKYALSVLLNYNKEQPESQQGIRRLHLMGLLEIIKGAVYFDSNEYLCFADTINWADLENKQSPQNVTNKLDFFKSTCKPCHPSCNGHCWDEGANYCQKFTSLHCAKQCDSRCNGPDSNNCCHRYCASGCTGPLDTDCFACRNVNDSGACIERCPPPEVYNQISLKQEPNPHGKYSYGATCLEKCPSHFVVDSNSCVRSCSANKMEVENSSGVKHCTACGDTCPTVCDGIGSGSLKESQTINSANIHLFQNCTKIRGNLVIQKPGINGDPYLRIERMNPEHLNYFRTVQEITGYFNIEGWPEELPDLGVFENLRVVQGRELRSSKEYSFLISNLNNITSLNLKSLQEISKGNILIQQNKKLCFYNSVNWTRLTGSTSTLIKIVDNNKNCDKQCDVLCSTDGCWGPGPSQCLACKHFQRNRTCVEACNLMHGEVREFTDGNMCKACNPECLPVNNNLTCNGPGSENCSACRNFKEGPLCVSKCPSGIQGENNTVIYKYPNAFNICMPCHTSCIHSCTGPNAEDCSGMAKHSMKLVVILSVLSIMFVIVVLVLGIFIFKRQQTKRRKKTLRKYIENELVQPLTPSGAVPNQSKLRIIKETHLKKGKVLGSGAFGTVYKGVWIPEGESVKISVAIKVLREATSPKANKEILDEAYLMARVEHPYLVQLLGICLTSTTQLVTQLMPHGCLLDYVREHVHKLNSQILLNWCVQIAKGMLYLEDQRLVHRDLAARNILVKAVNHVKITDFGLARLLDGDEQEYHAEGGKMPIKWMALESIQYRKFTHQSDVWSFGVTVWELMMFGGKPYDGIPAREIPDLLEKGERLPQPPICTIDVYMVMVKCWMIDAEARPRFSELISDFSKMARDPKRFLVIQGDGVHDLPSPFVSKFYKALLEEDDFKDLVDGEEYLNTKPFTLQPPPTGRRRGASAVTNGDSSAAPTSPTNSQVPLLADRRSSSRGTSGRAHGRAASFEGPVRDGGHGARVPVTPHPRLGRSVRHDGVEQGAKGMDGAAAAAAAAAAATTTTKCGIVPRVNSLRYLKSPGAQPSTEEESDVPPDPVWLQSGDPSLMLENPEYLVSPSAVAHGPRGDQQIYVNDFPSPMENPEYMEQDKTSSAGEPDCPLICDERPAPGSGATSESNLEYLNMQPAKSRPRQNGGVMLSTAENVEYLGDFAERPAAVTLHNSLSTHTTV